jgi:murein DD-endopeptidase MepM/ murein hydrolase activator NlpD
VIVRKTCFLFFLLAGFTASPGVAQPPGALRIELRPPQPAPGQVFAVRAEGIALPEGAVPEVRVGGRSFPLWKEEGGWWEGLAALDRDELAGIRDLLLVACRPEGDEPITVVELTVPGREYGLQRLSVDPDMVKLSPENEARAERENRRIRALLSERGPERHWAFPFALPAEGRISSPFGVRRVFNGEPKNYHGGIDIAAPRGAPIRAPAAGKVTLVGDFYFTGRTVIVDHGLGLQTAYFHLDTTAVAEGALVEPGRRLGTVGSTGRSTGPHLHWGVYVSGVRVDPESLLALNPVGGP